MRDTAYLDVALPIEQIIEPKSQFSLGLAELWQYRELFYFFTWRDVKVRYKQAFLGFLCIFRSRLSGFLPTHLAFVFGVGRSRPF